MTREWLQILDAVVKSPVRRTVKPDGLPSTRETEAVLDAARHAAGSVPQLARLLGLPIPPPARSDGVLREQSVPCAEALLPDLGAAT